MGSSKSSFHNKKNGKSGDLAGTNPSMLPSCGPNMWPQTVWGHADAFVPASTEVLSVCSTATANSDSPQGQHKCSQMGGLELGWKRDASVTRLTAKASEEIHHACISMIQSSWQNDKFHPRMWETWMHIMCPLLKHLEIWMRKNRDDSIEGSNVCIHFYPSSNKNKNKEKTWKSGNGINIHRRAHLWVEPYVCWC